MKERIKKTLADIESEEDLVICHAVESGSRAWGFPSADSDYDVRFIYVRRPEWYLSIDLERKSDVIELMCDGILDIVGWDIRKALYLFGKSNPALMERLQCKIVYCEFSSLPSRLREFLPAYFSPRAGFYHYLHMAKGVYEKSLSGELVKAKDYFYVLRPLLAILWIEKGLGPVPIEFSRLLDATVKDRVLCTDVSNLLRAKRAGKELDKVPRIESIDRFVEEQLGRGDWDDKQLSHPTADISKLDELFRDTLSEVWALNKIISGDCHSGGG